MTIPEEITNYVDMVMTDPDVSKSAADKAEEAVQFIESYARAETGTPDGVPLEVPVEWRHKVAGLVDAVTDRASDAFQQFWEYRPGDVVEGKFSRFFRRLLDGAPHNP